jgi:hypothetical protein
MSFPVVFNSTNYVNQNTYKMQLSTTTDLSEYEVAIGQMYLYYSWYNINASPLNNNRYTLTIPKNGGSDTLNIVIPDGAYNITDLNNQLQYQLIQGGYYITNNTTGTNTYYCNFALSPTSYSVQFTTYPMPTSLPTGYTSGGMTFPASSNQHYQLTISSTNNFKDIIGYNPGTYPSSATNVGTQTKNSDYTPNVNPVSSVQVRLSCVYNILSSNTQLIHLFTNQGSSIGQIIDASPSFEQFTPCVGQHRELTVTFYDQNGYVLNILDKNLIIKLLFRKKQ